jgi:hypothetical protein
MTGRGGREDNHNSCKLLFLNLDEIAPLIKCRAALSAYRKPETQLIKIHRGRTRPSCAEMYTLTLVGTRNCFLQTCAVFDNEKISGVSKLG